jgi:hypothetical protein
MNAYLKRLKINILFRVCKDHRHDLQGCSLLLICHSCESRNLRQLRENGFPCFHESLVGIHFLILMVFGGSRLGERTV